MPGISRRPQRTRCSFCFRAYKVPQMSIAVRTAGGGLRTLYRLCWDCGYDQLFRLRARPRGIVA